MTQPNKAPFSYGQHLDYSAEIAAAKEYLAENEAFKLQQQAQQQAFAGVLQPLAEQRAVDIETTTANGLNAAVLMATLESDRDWDHDDKLAELKGLLPESVAKKAEYTAGYLRYFERAQTELEIERTKLQGRLSRAEKLGATAGVSKVANELKSIQQELESLDETEAAVLGYERARIAEVAEGAHPDPTDIDSFDFWGAQDKVSKPAPAATPRPAKKATATMKAADEASPNADKPAGRVTKAKTPQPQAAPEPKPAQPTPDDTPRLRGGTRIPEHLVRRAEEAHAKAMAAAKERRQAQKDENSRLTNTNDLDEQPPRLPSADPMESQDNVAVSRPGDTSRRAALGIASPEEPQAASDDLPEVATPAPQPEDPYEGDEPVQRLRDLYEAQRKGGDLGDDTDEDEWDVPSFLRDRKGTHVFGGETGAERLKFSVGSEQDNSAHGQDAMFVNESLALFAVMDGASSTPHAKLVADETAVRLQARFQTLPEARTVADAKAQMEQVFEAVADDVASMWLPTREAGVTTVTAVKLFKDPVSGKNFAILANAGDSRADIAYPDGRLVRISEDQNDDSSGRPIMSNGFGRFEDGSTYNQSASFKNQYGVYELPDGARIVLGTDGIAGDERSPSTHMTNEEILTHLSTPSVEQAAINLINGSKKYDDKTVIVVEVEGGGPRQAEPVTNPTTETTTAGSSTGEVAGPTTERQRRGARLIRALRRVPQALGYLGGSSLVPDRNQAASSAPVAASGPRPTPRPTRAPEQPIETTAGSAGGEGVIERLYRRAQDHRDQEADGGAAASPTTASEQPIEGALSPEEATQRAHAIIEDMRNTVKRLQSDPPALRVYSRVDENNPESGQFERDRATLASLDEQLDPGLRATVEHMLKELEDRMVKVLGALKAEERLNELEADA